jgi:tetrahydromethanopterin S-methyltransferase subunit G
VADKDEAGRVTEAQAQDIQQIKKRLDLLDQRLDNIDSMVSAVAERVMSQPITLNITCPRCGRNIELTLIGSHKPAR